jgi:hypothetical protein
MESSARDSQSVFSLPVTREYYDQGSVSVNERPVSVNERPVSVNEYPQRIIFREQSQGYSKKRKRDEEFATLCVMMNGQVVPLQVQIGSLRAALDMC